MADITVGMATYDDFDGVYFTVQALKMYHTDVDFELVVVDNNPNSEHGKATESLINNWSKGFPAKYVPMTESVGTTQSRNRVFEEASSELVMCIDCHVLLPPNALSSFVEWYKTRRGSERDDLFQGPIWMDCLENQATHFDMRWRSEMWGIWGQAWGCKKDGCPGSFSVQGSQFTDANKCSFHELTIEHEAARRCPQCAAAFPVNLDWPGHVQVLQDQGYRRLGMDPSDPPFEIPAQGLGLFAARKETWLGFNPHFSGFGGEEGYIHMKYRRAGRKTLCLPFLHWGHRFGRIGGTKYPLNRIAKMRNYMIGHMENEMDLRPLFDHFVGGNLVPEAVWAEMERDPINFTVNLAPERLQVKTSQLPQPPAGMTVPEIFDWATQQPRDLDQHLERLKRYAAMCDHVTEFSKRRESSVALLAAFPKVVRSYQNERDILVEKTLPEAMKRHSDADMTWTCTIGDSITIPQIDRTDMLFIDTEHTGERVYEELKQHGDQVDRFIVFHDVTLYGEKGPNGEPGLLHGIKRWVEEKKAAGEVWWSIDFTPAQHGLLVLGNREEDRPFNNETGEVVVIHAWMPEKGAGTEMKKLLKKWLGIVATKNCSCNARANLMDINGPQWCRDNIEQILDWLKEEADKRKAAGTLKAPFVRSGAKLMVMRAIKIAERQIRREGNNGPDGIGVPVGQGMANEDRGGDTAGSE